MNCVGEWSARDALDWDNIIALEVLVDPGAGLLLQAFFDGADTEVVRYLSAEQASRLRERVFWAGGAAATG